MTSYNAMGLSPGVPAGNSGLSAKPMLKFLKRSVAERFLNSQPGQQTEQLSKMSKKNGFSNTVFFIIVFGCFVYFSPSSTFFSWALIYIPE